LGTSSKLKELDHDEILDLVNIGNFVALKIQSYCDELPQIGKVVVINETSVTVDWLVGTYSSTFSYWKEKGEVIQEHFPLRGVICPLKFTTSMRLARPDIAALKNIYTSTEFV
jgi:hypothetical protein